MDKGAVSSWLSGLCGAHALQFARETERKEFLFTLLRSSSAKYWWAIPGDGGLLTDLGPLENVLLPAQAKGDGAAEARLARWLRRLAAGDISAPPLSAPLASLSPWQARLTAYLRAVVADAPALIFDDTCYGLAAEERRQAIQLHGLFRYYFPFRPTVYITLSAPPAELNIPSGNFHRHDNVFA
jgi:hypothetical protein